MSILDDIGSIFTAPVDAVEDVVSFLQWIAWLFNPINWLRAVEFVVGGILFFMGLKMAVRQQAPSAGSQLKTFVKEIPGLQTVAKLAK